MGSCAPQRQFSCNNVRESSRGRPKLVFDVQIWPLNKQVNFKDEATSIRESFQFVVQQGDTQTLQLLNDQKRLNMPKVITQRESHDARCKISRQNNKFDITFQGSKVGRSATNWLQMKEDEVCVIGKTKYKLSKLVEKKNHQQKMPKQLKSISFLTQSRTDADKKCRVCYSSQECEQNPLINPCQCKGSIEFIHLQCLSDWLFGKIGENQLLQIQTRKSTCEICKTNITQTDAYRYITTSILSGNHSIAQPFAIFEGFLQNERMQAQKNYLILSFAKKRQFKVGRSHHADIYEKADRFVSRINSSIAYQNNRIWIKDNQSKHGTSVILTNKLTLSSQNQMENLIYGNMSMKIIYKQD